MKKIIITLTLSLILISPLLTSIHCTKSSKDEDLIIWAWGDMKIWSRGPEKTRQAIRDMNGVFWHISIVVGDIVEGPKHAEESDYEVWLRILNESTHPRSDFYILAGNHEWNRSRDVNPIGILNYRKKICPKLNYTFKIGNILFIIISTDKCDTGIKESTYAWFNRTVAENQDKIIVVATHQPWDHEHFRDDPGYNFEEVLRKYYIDVWIYGHTHLPHSNPKSLYKKYGCIFIDVGFIENGESRVIYFFKNSNLIIIKSRNHLTGTWQKEYECTFQLRMKFIGRPILLQQEYKRLSEMVKRQIEEITKLRKLEHEVTVLSQNIKQLIVQLELTQLCLTILFLIVIGYFTYSYLKRHKTRPTQYG